MIIAVENVMADCGIAPVDLVAVSGVPGFNYVPRRFAAAMATVDGASISVFERTITSMGTRTADEAFAAMAGAIRQLSDGGIRTRLVGSPSVSNLTCTVYPEKGDKPAGLPEGRRMDPFNGCKITDEDGATIMLYPGTRNVVITGVRTVAQAATSARRLFQA